MKILMMVQAKEKIDFSHFYSSIGDYCDLELLRLNNSEQEHFATYGNQIDFHRYDRVILFLRFKIIMKQASYLATIPNLVFFEHDSVQNYLTSSKYQGKFLKLYKLIPWARVITSGYQITQRFLMNNVDAVFVPKGYDDSYLSNIQLERTIEFGFIGSTKRKVYNTRKKYLEKAKTALGLNILPACYRNDYNNQLNSIRFFLSPDKGMGEYMIKNFEAMACGCVLFAYNQGEEENKKLGFKDGENIVLFNTFDELALKFQALKDNHEKAAQIAKAGTELAQNYYTYRHMAKNLVNALTSPLRPQGKLSFLKRITALFL